METTQGFLQSIRHTAVFAWALMGINDHAGDIAKLQQTEKAASTGQKAAEPHRAASKPSFVSYTISEDRTGDETSVKRAKLAPLAKTMQKSERIHVSYTISEDYTGGEMAVVHARLAPLAKTARFGARERLEGRPSSLSDPATRKALGLNKRRETENKPPLSLVLRRDETPSLNRLKRAHGK